MDCKTKVLHTSALHDDPYGALAMPVYHTAAFQFPDAASMVEAFSGRSGEPDYSRTMNPTVSFFERKVAALTGAATVTAFNSGMAAISNFFLASLKAGQNVIASRHMFGNTFSLLTHTLAKFGIETRVVDLLNLEEVDQAIDANTGLVFLEIITNPQLEVADLPGLSRICKAHQVPLVADTTIIPFTEFDASALGLDFQLVSSTKYLSGGATSLGGLIIDYGHFKQISQVIQSEMLFNLGSYMTPHAAYMQTIGLETLAARYAVQSAHALALAQKLQSLPQVQKVGYVGLPNNRFYALAQRQFGPTAGAMLTFDLASQEACFSCINGLKLIYRATNLFDNRTLAIHPYSTIFVNYTAEEKARMDVLPTTIRLSVGLEDVDDLFADLQQALTEIHE